jgi:hypothetical protein
MRIKSESEILDLGTRKKIIEEINGQENKRRKNDQYIRHMIYKDRSDHFVQKTMLRWFDQQTVDEMSYALSNVSLVKKIVDKLSRVYSHGVKRTVLNEDGQENEESTVNLQTLEKELDINSALKTTNRYLKLHRNTTFYVKPCPTEDDKWRIVLQPLAPYLYDAIEDFYDRTKPLCHILSNFDFQDVEY